MFENRKLVIATQHQKEQVIAPLFEKELGVKCIVPEAFDSDLFGTFSGEIERKNSALETVRNKCLAAMQQTKTDLGIASEGSFGPHPSIFFASADEEIVMLIDKKNDLEIIIRELSLETNFNSATINSIAELKDFAEQSGFPSHALILKKSENGAVYKDITSYDDLIEKAKNLLSQNTPITVETDMRAMNNPTRMKVIEKATQQLILKIKSLCPECQTPGFGIVKTQSGLPCAWCNSETKSIYSHWYQCQKCHFESEIKFPNGKKTEDPTYCDYCNP